MRGTKPASQAPQLEVLLAVGALVLGGWIAAGLTLCGVHWWLAIAAGAAFVLACWWLIIRAGVRESRASRAGKGESDG